LDELHLLPVNYLILFPPVSFLSLLWQNTESVRNFLIDKLKSAETEIKSLMAASSALKKQAVSDQEVRAQLIFLVSASALRCLHFTLG
jgi:hypothetical protein